MVLQSSLTLPIKQKLLTIDSFIFFFSSSICYECVCLSYDLTLKRFFRFCFLSKDRPSIRFCRHIVASCCTKSSTYTLIQHFYKIIEEAMCTRFVCILFICNRYYGIFPLLCQSKKRLLVTDSSLLLSRLRIQKTIDRKWHRVSSPLFHFSFSELKRLFLLNFVRSLLIQLSYIWVCYYLLWFSFSSAKR